MILSMDGAIIGQASKSQEVQSLQEMIDRAEWVHYDGNPNRELSNNSHPIWSSVLGARPKIEVFIC